MKKLFLTSGLVLCMACPAFAAFDIAPDANPGSNPTTYPLTGTGATGNATCQYPNTLTVQDGTQQFYAKWTANTYNVKYNPGNAMAKSTAIPASGTAVYDRATYASDYTVKANTAAALQAMYVADTGTTTASSATAFAVEGFTFDKWVSDYDFANATANTSANINANHTGSDAEYSVGAHGTYNVYDPAVINFYAKWTPNTATITLTDTNSANTDNGITGGTGTIWTRYKNGVYDDADEAAGMNWAEYGISSVSVPEQTGYTFTGYYTEASGGYQYFDEEGALVTPESPNPALDAWKSGVNATGTLYAHWTAKEGSIVYTCGTAQGTSSFDTENGSIADVTVSKNYDEGYTMQANAGNCILPGYHFAGWHCDKNIDTGATPENGIDYAAGEGSGNALTISKTGTFQVEGTITCNVIWAKNTIGLSWNVPTGTTAQGGGTYSAGSSSCTYDEGITVGAKPYKAGYTFDGWTTNQNDSHVLQ